MKIIESILTKNLCYRANRRINVKGLMIHSVGCSQPKASVFIKKWNKEGYDVCVHGFIDGNTGDIYQTLPWNHRGWHAGGSANNTHIGIEMCEPSTIKYISGSTWIETKDGTNTKETVMRTYKSAVELSAYLCKEYGLDPMADGVVISHSEGYKRGIATNHGDVEHIWNQFGLTMSKFRRDIKDRMNDDITNETSLLKPYLIKVNINNLNMRIGPDITYPSIGYIPRGVYTITEICGKWGRLKSKQKYNGKMVYVWIHTDYITRI